MSGPGTSPLSASASGLSEEGENWFWQFIRTKSDGERGAAAASINAMMAGGTFFAGLFAAIVASFILVSITSLSPSDNANTELLLAQIIHILDPNVTLAVPIEPFTISGRDKAVNVLWIVSLIMSLAAALLATLIQVWISGTTRVDGVYDNGPAEQFGYRQLNNMVAIDRYGLDQLVNLVVGLIHGSLTMYLVGLAIFISAFDRTVSFVVIASAATTTAIYAGISIIQYFDRDCPYYTPLTFILRPILHVLVAVVAVIVLAFIFSFLLLKKWIVEMNIELQDLNFRSILYQLVRHASHTQHTLRYYIPAYLRGASDQELERIIDRNFNPPVAHAQLSGDQVRWALELAWRDVLETPIALWYMSRCLLDLSRPGVAEIFVGLRSNRAAMMDLAPVLTRIDSVPSAVGAIRLLHALFIADASVEPHSRPEGYDDSRWELADAIMSALPAAIQRVEAQNNAALQAGDPTLHMALASLRWALIRVWGDIEGNPDPGEPGYLARSRLQLLFKLLHGSSEGLRLCSMSVDDDSGDLTSLFESTPDPRLNLATRNVLTLLRGLQRCKWRGNWLQPDSSFLPASAPSIWEWRQLPFAHLPLPRSSASNCFRELLIQEKVAISHNPIHTVSNLSQLHPKILNALDDLSYVVDLHAAPEPVISVYEEGGETAVKPCHPGIPLITLPNPSVALDET
ncbi:unnamed protein product [Peniophora sp. CBMAI 1063]|nr:unnamed protein product [Peniophora sp. CBMAI 1063]